MDGLVESNQELLDAQINIARRIELGMIIAGDDQYISYQLLLGANKARDAQWRTVTLLKKSMRVSQQILETSIPRILECFNNGRQGLATHYLEQTLEWTKEMAEETNGKEWYNAVFEQMVEIYRMMGKKSNKQDDELRVKETEIERIQCLIHVRCVKQKKLEKKLKSDKGPGITDTEFSFGEKIKIFFGVTRQQNSKDIHHSEETEQKTKKIKNIQDSIDELKHQLEQLEEECELMKMKVKKNPREKVCAIFKIDHYLNRINQFFSNMEDFLEMQKKVAQIAGLAIPDQGSSYFLVKDMGTMQERWEIFMRACKEYVIRCDGDGEWSTALLFEFMDGRLEDLDEKGRTDRMEELKKPAIEVRFCIEGPK